MDSTSTTQAVENTSFKDVAIEKFNKVKSTSIEYLDVSKKYVKENPLMSIGLAGAALITSIPLFFVLSIFSISVLSVFSVAFVIISIMACISSIILFIPVTSTIITLMAYYTFYYLAYNTYSKISVTLNEDSEATFSIKLVVDSFVSTFKQYTEHVRNIYNNVISFVIEKLNILKLQELTKNVNFEGIKNKKDEVMQRIKNVNFRQFGKKNELNEQQLAIPTELAKKEE